MTATTIAALSGVRLDAWSSLRTVMICVLGVLIGSSFTPDILGALPKWAGAILILIVHMGVVSVLCHAFLHRIAHLDQITAFFSSAPGGLTNMVIQAEEAGADVRAVSLIHAARILVVVAIVPVYFRLTHHISTSMLPPSPVHGRLTLEELAILIACAVGGTAVGNMLRMPTPALLGPMAVSILAHVTGTSHIAPPSALVAAAQVVIGAGIGLRFVGSRFADLTHSVIYGAGSALIMIVAACVTAEVTSRILGLRMEAMVLSLVPGGLTEMSLVALALGIETAFVATMHVVRILLVIVGAPLLFRGFSRANEDLTPRV